MQDWSYASKSKFWAVFSQFSCPSQWCNNFYIIKCFQLRSRYFFAVSDSSGWYARSAFMVVSGIWQRPLAFINLHLVTLDLKAKQHITAAVLELLKFQRTREAWVIPTVLPRHRYFNTYNMLFINTHHCRCWPLVEHFTVVCFHGCLPVQHKSCICWYGSSMWEILYHAVSQRKVRSLQETELPLSIFGSLLSFVLIFLFYPHYWESLYSH